MTSASQSSKARSVESLAHLHTVFIPLSPIVREGGYVSGKRRPSDYHPCRTGSSKGTGTGVAKPSVARDMNTIMGAGYPNERAEHSPQEGRSGGETSLLYDG